MKAYRGTVNNLQLDQIIIKFNWIEWAKKVHKLYPDPDQLQCITNRRTYKGVPREPRGPEKSPRRCVEGRIHVRKFPKVKLLCWAVQWMHVVLIIFRVNRHKLPLKSAHLSSLELTWLHLSSLEFTWTHSSSLGLPWVHLSSLELTFKIWKRILKGQTRASPFSAVWIVWYLSSPQI